ncbi:MAG: dTDP-4-keto-6-deoxy-D-glucose epimerase [Chlorobium sp.]|nr:MAG: dTDP-4-keto-6-deoxy-D-glucose epimerase [Chlorobium sp.]
MQVKETAIPGCFEIIPNIVRDDRGCFIKTFQKALFEKHGLETAWREEYYTTSHKGVLRGLHFQLPPHDHAKMVYCTFGEVMDVVLDLRVGSSAYGLHQTFSLSATDAHIIYIPKGCAHGFYTISDQATIMYKVTTEYTPASDSGLLWSSAGIIWPLQELCISDRDKNFQRFSEFTSPFRI